MTARGDSSPPLTTEASTGRAATAPAVTMALILTLALQSAVPPFATDMYTPAFPQVTADLAATASLVGLTLTTFFPRHGGGTAARRTVVGPAWPADANDRRWLDLHHRSRRLCPRAIHLGPDRVPDRAGVRRRPGRFQQFLVAKRLIRHIVFAAERTWHVVDVTRRRATPEDRPATEQTMRQSPQGPVHVQRRAQTFCGFKRDAADPGTGKEPGAARTASTDIEL